MAERGLLYRDKRYSPYEAQTLLTPDGATIQ